MEQSKRNVNPIFFAKIFLFSYVLTAVFLLLLAMLLYKFRLSETVTNIGIILIYILACFFSGFLTGKKMGSRKFLWGMLVGIGYFAILALLSIAVQKGTIQLSGSFLSTLFLCAGSGMLGGMLS
ncbi:MAG: TIGR04086 family membrane protein [Lachnospiraceae bacterium]|nr:TIGR04086 family membrane protein [Lachnospiraceae bacterium]